MSDITLIFSHYGYSGYLEYTLACARKTNPNARLVLLGDERNIDVARRNGWEHYFLGDCQSRYRTRFGKHFRHIQGVNHDHIKNGQDWLRYVFERWILIDGFVASESIDRFWHFDSDTMVLHDLRPYSLELQTVDFSVQCNGTCLNGVVSAVVVAEFCEHICYLFENDEYIAAQQHEFDTIHPDWAFTEMRAFDHYKSTSSRPWMHLLHYGGNKVFDDCICQEHGFQMCALPSGEMVKLLFAKGGKVSGIQDGREVEFVTLNLSWVPDYVFQWVLVSLNGKDSCVERAPCSIRQSMRGVARMVKRLAKRAFV